MNAVSRLVTEAEAEALGIRMVYSVPVAGNPRLSWIIKCASCGASHKAAWPPDTPIEQIIKIMKGKHWYFGHSKTPKCSSCMKGKKGDDQPMTTAIAANVPTVPSPKIQRAVYASLEENFDDGAHRYRPGWDDAKVAKEVGCAPQIVVKLREDAFGKLAENPAITALRDDIELARMEFEETSRTWTSKLGELSRRLSAISG